MTAADPRVEAAARAMAEHSIHEDAGSWGWITLARAALAAADAVQPDTVTTADAWDEGYAAGENMAHLWGHVDWWEHPPSNPYRPDQTGDE